MTLLSRQVLSTKYRIVPGRVTVSLTRNPNSSAAVTYQVTDCRERPRRQAPMQGGPFFTEPYTTIFTLPRATLAGIVPQGGDRITESDGTSWTVQANGVRLLQQYYKCECTKDPKPIEFVPEAPPSSGGDPEEPPGDPPTATITAVSPDPRATSVSTIEIVFSKVVSGVDLDDFTLTRDGGANLLSGSQSIATSDNMTYTLSGLSGITGTNGTYLLTLVASGSGIVDAADQALAGNATETWVFNSALFTAAITPVSPDPRNTAVSSITIVFSAAVASGFTIADLSLTRDGGSNLLTGSQTLTTANNITWTLGNLSGLTGTSGDYLLTLNHSGSGIVDGSANPLASSVTESWDTDATVPTATITPVTADPRTEPVESVQVVFSEAVVGVTAGDFTLSRDGGANLLTGSETVSTSDNVTWTLHGLTAVTAATGTYLLTLVASGSSIEDLGGNDLAANATDSWVTVAPSVAALPTSDDRLEAGIYQTSFFLDVAGGPFPHKMCGILVSYDQATVDEDEVLTGLPGGAAKVTTNLDKFTLAAPQSLRFLEVTGSGLLTEDIMNAYRATGLAARYGGRGVYPVHGIQYDATTHTASRIRSDWGVRPFGTGSGQSIVSTAYLDLSTASNRAFWAAEMIDHVAPFFAAYPQYQGMWMDEMADKLLDPNHGPLIETYTEYVGVIRDAIRATGKLISTNLSTHFLFTEAAADAIVDNVDVLMVEKCFSKAKMNTSDFATAISRMRRMWARNEGGFGIFNYQGVDFDGSIRTCTITAAANGPSGGMRVTCSTPHYLDNTANKTTNVTGLTGIDSAVNYPATKVTDTVFDLLTAPQTGTLSPTGSSTARFTESDLEVGAALGMIARQQAGRPYYMLWTPLTEYQTYRWPSLYGQPVGDYVIDATSGSLITQLHCDFAGGSLGPHRCWVEPQTARRAYWEAL